MMTIADLDRLVAVALTAAIDDQPVRFTRTGKQSAWPDERKWGRDALSELAVPEGLPDPMLDAEHLRVPLGDWNPAPGKVDLHPRLPGGEPGSLFVAELKLDQVSQSVWDAMKLIWVGEALQTGPQYVACATQTWARQPWSEALFPSDGLLRVTRSVDLIGACIEDWCSQWRRDTAKPLRVPNELNVAPVVAGHRPRQYPHLELRVSRISARDGQKLPLANGVPPSLLGCLDAETF